MAEKHGGTRGGARGLPVGGANGFKMHFCAPAVTLASLVFPAACSPGCKRKRETWQEQIFRLFFSLVATRSLWSRRSLTWRVLPVRHPL